MSESGLKLPVRTEAQARAQIALNEYLSGVAAGPGIVARATSYTDKIAATIFDAMKARDPDGIITECGRVKWDLHPTEGYLLSTTKTLEVTDRNGNRYRVTIEDAR